MFKKILATFLLRPAIACCVANKLTNKVYLPSRATNAARRSAPLYGGGGSLPGRLPPPP